MSTNNQNHLQVSTFHSFDSGSGEGGSEVVAWEGDRLFVTNGAESRIDVFSVSTGEKVGEIDLSDILGFAGVNSVAVKNGVLVAAVETALNVVEGQPLVANNGYAAFFSAASLNALGRVEVGVLPDMATFTPDGNKVLVANEGEPDSDAGFDAPGGVSIIDISAGVENASAIHLGFEQFDGQEEALREQGVRIFPDKAPSVDFEPEYIAVSPDGSKAFVTLQEANTVAVIDLANNAVSELLPLGVVDHLNGIVTASGEVIPAPLDPSDRDDAINIQPHPVFGIRMPDAIAAFEVDGTVYFATANEGDARDEDARVKDLDLDPEAFPNAAELQEDAELGRLTVSTIDGDTDGDGLHEALYAYGSRSFSIFDEQGNLIFDSGADFEQIIAELNPELFNSDHEVDEFDNRSDNKGPEPEAIAVGEMGGRLYAFIGLERDSGIMIYNIDEPANSHFVGYVNSRELGHTGPEIIEFVPSAESVSGMPQLAVSYEVSGTTVLYDLEQLANGEVITSFRADSDLARIESVYHAVLGRDGDADGVGYWLSEMESGLTLADLVTSFLQSSEHQQADAGARDFVEGLYQNALGREADAAGVDYWLDDLEHGASRADVALSFIHSDEFQSVRLTGIAGDGIDFTPWVV